MTPSDTSAKWNRPWPGLKTRGFTLIEIMVVVIVLAVVAATLLPNLGGVLERAKIDSAASRLRELLDFCYQASTATGRVHGLIISHDGRHARLVAEPSAAAGKDDGETNDRGGSRGSINLQKGDSEEGRELESIGLPGFTGELLPEGVMLIDTSQGNEPAPDELEMEPKQPDEQSENGGLRILFYPDGSSDFARLTLVARGDVRVVELNGLTGAVAIRVPGLEAPGEEGGTLETRMSGRTNVSVSKMKAKGSETSEETTAESATTDAEGTDEEIKPNARYRDADEDEGGNSTRQGYREGADE